MRATPHTEDFARALEGGALLLWTAVPTPEREAIRLIPALFGDRQAAMAILLPTCTLRPAPAIGERPACFIQP